MQCGTAVRRERERERERETEREREREREKRERERERERDFLKRQNMGERKRDVDESTGLHRRGAELYGRAAEHTDI